MSDDLTVTSGGGTSVAVDDLFVEAVRLGTVSAVADDWSTRAGVVRRGLRLLDLDAEPGAWGSVDPDHHLMMASYRLDETAQQSEQLRRALLETARRYGETEARVAFFWDLGFRLGAATVAPFVAALAVPIAMHAAAGWWASSALGAHPERMLRQVLSDPSTLPVVRAAGGAVDEFLLGMLGMPPPLAALLGDQLRAPENASVLLLAAASAGLLGAGVLTERAVTVRPVGASAADPLGARRTPPPAGLGEVARRIPDSDEGAPQIIVEQYGAGDAARYVVYVGGTVTFDPQAGRQAMDLTNAVAGVEEASDLPVDALLPEASAAGERAVLAALEGAGARADSPVFVVGHSAGGTIAAALTARSDMNVVAGASFGGPVRAFDTGTTPFLSVEHQNDLVPMLGGAQTSESPGRLTVARPVDLADSDDSAPVPAHALDRYRETAAVMDGSDVPEIVAFEYLLDDFTGGEPAVRTAWLAERVAPTEPSADVSSCSAER